MRKTEKIMVETEIERIYCDNCEAKIHTVWSCWACEKEYCKKCSKEKLKQYSQFMKLCEDCEPDFKEDIIKYDQLCKASQEAIGKLHEKNIARRKNE